MNPPPPCALMDTTKVTQSHLRTRKFGIGLRNWWNQSKTQNQIGKKVVSYAKAATIVLCPYIYGPSRIQFCEFLWIVHYYSIRENCLKWWSVMVPVQCTLSLYPYRFRNGPPVELRRSRLRVSWECRSKIQRGNIFPLFPCTEVRGCGGLDTVAADLFCGHNLTLRKTFLLPTTYTNIFSCRSTGRHRIVSLHLYHTTHGRSA